MVTVISRRAGELGLNQVEAREMDMDALDFPDGCFDVVTCRWGFTFTHDPVRAISEARRVLRTGGLLVTVNWAIGPANTWMSIAQRALASAATSGGGAPPSPLATSNDVEDALQKAGFEQISVEQRVFPFQFPSGEAWWSFFVDFGNAVMARISPEEQVRARNIAVAEAETHRHEGELLLDAACTCAVATK
jgi:SAM-dependent methyltransferase